MAADGVTLLVLHQTCTWRKIGFCKSLKAQSIPTAHSQYTKRCWELVAKRNHSWVLKYVKSAQGETDVPDRVPEWISQRRR